MKKRLSLLIIILLTIVGCSKKNPLNFQDLVDSFTNEFKEVSNVEVSTEKDDELLNKGGYYIGKAIFYAEDNSQLLNLEFFDNEKDLSNREQYLTKVIGTGHDLLYYEMSNDTGGINNIKNIIYVMGGDMFELESYITKGPLLLRFKDSKGINKDYVDFIEKFVYSNNVAFNNQSNEHYDPNEKIEKLSLDENYLYDLLDTAYLYYTEPLISDSEELLSLKLDDAIREYNNFKSDLGDVIPYFETNFKTDSRFDNLHTHVENEKEKIREEERLASEERKKKKEETLNEYIKGLFTTLNNNGGGKTEYGVTLEEVSGKEYIQIRQYIVDETLKLELGQNLVNGKYKEETKYMMDNLRSMISTTISTNPTDKEIMYLIVNPYNLDSYIYMNTNGIEQHNDFNE